MGSWSVYCGISKIAITASQECVLLPIKKNTKFMSYGDFVAATLPIFGKYDDYGGIEKIEEDENTKLIEEHFNCSIDDFCYFFTRRNYDTSDINVTLLNNEEIKEWNYMFIDRKVYNFMSTNIGYGYDGRGHLDFGNKDILELIGFKFISENKALGRYKYEWKFGKNIFLSDGSFLNTIDGKSIHYFSNNDYNNLTDYIKLPNDKLWIGDKAMWELWEFIDNYTIKNELFYSLGVKNMDTDKFMLDLIKSMKESNLELDDYLKKIDEENKVTSLVQKYIANYRIYGKLLCDLRTLLYNFHPMSFSFEPFKVHLTPQCGEYKQHQILLEKFSEINKSYIINE